MGLVGKITIKDYELHVLTFGTILFVGAWLLKDKLSAPEVIWFTCGLLGFILMAISVTEIIHRLGQGK